MWLESWFQGAAGRAVLLPPGSRPRPEVGVKAEGSGQRARGAGLRVSGRDRMGPSLQNHRARNGRLSCPLHRAGSVPMGQPQHRPGAAAGWVSWRRFWPKRAYRGQGDSLNALGGGGAPASLHVDVFLFHGLNMLILLYIFSLQFIFL